MGVLTKYYIYPMGLKHKKINIQFEEEAHIYYDKDTKIEFTSVTTFLSEFKNKFDEEYWSKKKAKERGVSQEEVLAEWAEISRVACEYGTNVHNALEQYVLTGEETCEYPNLIDNFKELRKEYKHRLLPEKVMYDGDVLLAGTMDLGEVDVDNKRIWVRDYKTNRKGIEKNSFGKYMQYPCNKLPDASFYHYALQLSVYGYMWEKHGYSVEGTEILYIHPETYEFEIIPTPYYRGVVEEIFAIREGMVREKMWLFDDGNDGVSV